MTKNEKSTSVSPVEQPTKKSSKEKIEALLGKTEVSPTEKPKKVETRGRKKKVKKPVYTKTKYSENPMAKALNGIVIGIANKSILKDAKEKLTKDDVEIGEATIYLVDYYGASVLGHPIFVLISAFVGLGMVTFEKIKTVPRKTEEREQIKKRNKLT